VKQQFLSQLGQSPLLLLPLFALFLFLAVFVTWVLRAYLLPAETITKLSALPLEDDAPRTERSPSEPPRLLEPDHVR